MLFQVTLASMLLAVFLVLGCTQSKETGTVTATATALAASPTPSPVASSAPLSVAALKYRLLDRFPDFFYCDPDYYPIGRGDEQERAIERFPAIRADIVEYEAIAARLGLSSGDLTPEQKLQVYREHKKLAALVLEPQDGAHRFELRVSQDGKGDSGQSVQGTIDRSGVIKVTKTETTFVTCPICLTRGTMIDTPAGPVRVEELRLGMSVWTVSRSGDRVVAPAKSVAAAVVPPQHLVVRVALDDGRVVTASPGHPTADGRLVGDLRVGDTLDGGTVISVSVVKYADGHTYDVLPGGDTGSYWANGILLGSSLLHQDAD